jgi:hypothetical protein
MSRPALPGAPQPGARYEDAVAGDTTGGSEETARFKAG